MLQDASDMTRLFHLPIPAVIAGTEWIPHPCPSPETPVLSFGNWKNHRPGWIQLQSHALCITEDEKWRQHPDGPFMIDGGEDSIQRILFYIIDMIPRIIAGATSSTRTDAPINE